MSRDYLKTLNDLAGALLRVEKIRTVIQNLKESVRHTDNAFVWSVIDRGLLPARLPGEIRSAWIFVLKSGIPSGCHYHPNSIQHMVMVEGAGTSAVGGHTRRMIPFASTGHALEDIWYVIGHGVEHEFFPEAQDMVVMSFHTCEAKELEEVVAGSGERRLYEGKD